STPRREARAACPTSRCTASAVRSGVSSSPLLRPGSPRLAPRDRDHVGRDLRQVERLQRDAAALGDAEEGLGLVVAEGHLDRGRDALTDDDEAAGRDQRAAGARADAAASRLAAAEPGAAGAGQVERRTADQRVDDVDLRRAARLADRARRREGGEGDVEVHRRRREHLLAVATEPDVPAVLALDLLTQALVARRPWLLDVVRHVD